MRKQFTIPLRNVFWSRVDKNGPVPPHRPELGRCWLWIGTVLPPPSGYGRLIHQRVSYRVHRLSYEWAYGPLAPGLLACHKCDVRHCIRPSHLFAGTTSDNVKDMWAKGRGVQVSRFPTGDAHHFRRNPESIPRGDRHGSKTKPERIPRGTAIHTAKLNDDQVREIRRMYTAGEANQKALALRFGIAQKNISALIRRETWKHVS
jgi:hypothetical protein